MPASRRTVGVTAFASLLVAVGCPPADGVSCGEGTTLVGEVCLPDAAAGDDEATKPVVDSVALLELSVENPEDVLMVHYPVTIHGEIEVTGEDHFAAVHVTLATPDETQGCLIGSFSVEHVAPFDQEGVQRTDLPVTHGFHDTFAIPENCEPLAGRTDLVLHAAFDVWESTVFEGRSNLGFEEGDDPSFFELSVASRADDSECVDCDHELELLASPGLDVELADARLSNSVAILQYPRMVPEGTEVPDVTEERHIIATVDVQSWGQAEDQDHAADALGLTAEIRPVPDSQGTSGLPAEDLGWEPAHFRHDHPDEEGEYELDPELAYGEVPHVVPHYRHLHIDFAGDLHERLVSGDWAEIVEFTLRLCVTSEEPQADLGGLETDDDCVLEPIIIVRHGVTPDEHDLLLGEESTEARDFGPSSGLHPVHDTHWSVKKGSKDSAEFSAGAGWSIGSSEGLQSFNIIDRVPFEADEGGWFGAGAWAEATFFNQEITFFEVGAYFLDYTDETDEFHIRATLFAVDYVPRRAGGWSLPDEMVSLADLLNLMNGTGGEYSAEFTKEWAIPNLGIQFEVPCGKVKAGAFVVLTAGLDPGNTWVSKSSVPPTPGCDLNTQAVWHTADGDPMCTELFFQPDGGGPRRDAVEFCAEKGGALAPAVSVAHQDRIHQILKDPPTGFFPDDGDYTVSYFVNHSHEWAYDNSSCPQTYGQCWGPGGLTGHKDTDPLYIIPWDAGEPPSVADAGVRPYAIVVQATMPEFLPRVIAGTADSFTTAYACAFDAEPIRGGSHFDLVVTPHVAAGVAASASLAVDLTFAYLEFTLTTNLNVIDVSFPVIINFHYEFRDEAITGWAAFTLKEAFEALAGGVSATIAWETKVAVFFTKSGTHEKEIVSWDGISTEFDLVPRKVWSFRFD